jgi:hypothetical protein
MTRFALAAAAMLLALAPALALDGPRRFGERSSWTAEKLARFKLRVDDPWTIGSLRRSS